MTMAAFSTAPPSANLLSSNLETSNALKNMDTSAMSVSITSYIIIKTKADKLAISSILVVFVQLLFFGFNMP